jgi:hypothetical protein
MSTVVSHRALAALRFTCRSILISAVALSFAACHSGSSSGSHDRAPTTKPGNPDPTTPATYLVGGSIAGLSAVGLVLQNNGGDDLTIAAGATEFGFATKVAAGGSYQVSVLTQPAGLTCTISHGSGTNVAADVDTIKIACSADTYTIGGSVAGLTNEGLVLQNNGADDLAVSANATSLEFATPVAHDGSYNVTVLAQPTGQVCSVSNGNGSHVAADVGNVHVVCSAQTVPIGGTVSGLTVGGLVLRNNGGDDLAVPVNATSFEFATPVAFAGGYSVTVQTQPAGMTCTVNHGSGSNVAAAVDNIAVHCSVDAYGIGGAISGLTNSGLVLRNNGGDDLAVPANATSFQFATPVAHGGSYNATVQQQPSGLTCVVNNGSGSNVAGNVASIGISCSVNTYTIGGTVNGLVGSVVLQNNAGDNLPLNANGSFTFATPVAEDGSYNVTVLTQPASQICTVGNGSGLHVSTNITNVTINCAAATFPIGGAISGLSANGLVLQNNGGDDLPVLSGATTFEFATPVAYGGSYNATVLQQPAGQTCGVTNGSGTNVAANVTNVSVDCVMVPMPTINAVNLNFGDVSGGDIVTITGTGLTGATSVTFGGNAAVIMTVNSDTSITVVVPVGSPGAVDVTVTTPGGSATISGGYVYMI